MKRHDRDDRAGSVRGLTQVAQENVDTILAMAAEENARVGPLRSLIERLSSLCGTPGYFFFASSFILFWIVINLIGRSRRLARTSTSHRSSGCRASSARTPCC